MQPNPATLVESELPNTHRGPTLYISSVNRSSADSSIREDGGSKTNATNRVGGKEVTERKRPPDWFVEYLEHRNEVRKKRREEDLEREARRMKIEEEKLEAFKKMTKLLEEFLKRQ